MKKDINILIIEDDEAQRQMYSDSFDTYNMGSEEYEFIYSSFKDDSKVPECLYNGRYDCIIVDLNWGTEEKQTSGNRFIDKMFHNYRIPIIVISGNLHLFDLSIEENALFKKYQRDHNFEDIMLEIIKMYETGYSRALGNLGELDKVMREAFWDHLTNNVFEWTRIDDVLKQKRLLRFMMIRVGEILSLYEGKHDIHNSIEFYIKPTLREKVYSGDIVDYCDRKYVVLSASCDLEQGNNDFVVLCKIDSTEIQELRKNIFSSEEVSRRNRSKLESLVNNKNQRYHLVPPCSVFEGGKIDFQQIITLENEEIERDTTVFATITPSFFKDIQARFSNYYGRQGQPQLDIEEITEFILSNEI